MAISPAPIGEVERGSGRHRQSVSAAQKPCTVQFSDGALDGVVAVETAWVGVQRSRDLRNRQLTWVFFEEERQDDALCLRVLGTWMGWIAFAIRRVGLSHEELRLLVVRRPVVFTHGGSPLMFEESA